MSMIPTESLKFTEARPKLSSILDRVFRREIRIRLYKGSTPVAAIVSIADLDRLEKYDLERQARFTELERIAQPFADVSPEELEEQVARAIAEVRAERAVAVS
jgi:prevent-host-death family protein